ncbi:MAG: molybdopterin molybdenumtransferase MoeA, partial [Dehalococcoidia bacterium]|nr:molybdopterin molybdenumtransferase MoeA [Dehalococcoidia bacterium]
MISVEEALGKILSSIHVLDAEDRPIMECLEQVLAEDIHSDVNVPPLDNSALDGYAVRSSDIVGASSQSHGVLRVIDTVMAGSISRRVVEPG